MVVSKNEPWNMTWMTCISKLGFIWPDPQSFQEGPPLAKSGERLLKLQTTSQVYENTK